MQVCDCVYADMVVSVPVCVRVCVCTGDAYQKIQVLWVTQVCCFFLPVSLQLRLMQSEQTMEAVVRERSLKVLKERCWQAYRPLENVYDP